MSQNPVTKAASAVGIVGGAIALAPVAVPTLHGIAGIAVIGLGVYATGTAVYKANSFLSDKATELFNDGSSVVDLIKGNIFSQSKPKEPAKPIPFNRQ
ncbi:MAG: hypothetical protein HGB01_06410 [Chlorobiaceae bacterium]|nr:hypothetical protein [Chlorobiaceae bacterium]